MIRFGSPYVLLSKTRVTTCARLPMVRRVSPHSTRANPTWSSSICACRTCPGSRSAEHCGRCRSCRSSWSRPRQRVRTWLRVWRPGRTITSRSRSCRRNWLHVSAPTCVVCNCRVLPDHRARGRCSEMSNCAEIRVWSSRRAKRWL